MRNERNMIYENAEYYFSLWQPRVLNNLDKYVVLRPQEVKQYYETDAYIKVIDLCIQNLDINYDLSPLRITEGKFEPYTFYYFLNKMIRKWFFYTYWNVKKNAIDLDDKQFELSVDNTKYKFTLQDLFDKGIIKLENAVYEHRYQFNGNEKDITFENFCTWLNRKDRINDDNFLNRLLTFNFDEYISNLNDAWKNDTSKLYDLMTNFKKYFNSCTIEFNLEVILRDIFKYYRSLGKTDLNIYIICEDNKIDRIRFSKIYR